MPTGYTAPVEAGEITELRDYIMICARAFGALITMRDEPLSAEIPENLASSTGYYDSTIAMLQDKIDELTAMSADDVLTASIAAKEEVIRLLKAEDESDRIRIERYKAMREKVEAWEPPGPDHVPLKDFMLKQIEISSDGLGRTREVPEMATGEAWRAERLEQIRDQLESVQARREDEIKRTAERNEWIAKLRASIPADQI